MPGRKAPLVTDEIYHIYNRGIARQPTFNKKREYQRAIKTLSFYKYYSPPASLSKYLVKSVEERKDISNRMKKGDILVEILSFCLMPNHFHFLLKQVKDSGISKYVGNFLNSYTRYFNVRNERDGSLFLDQFKATKIETDQQLIHVSRYIHLNPYTSHVISNFDDLKTYLWSSLREYLNQSSDIVCSTKMIFGLFNNKIQNYEKFVLDQADYQRKLGNIKHLILE